MRPNMFLLIYCILSIAFAQDDGLYPDPPPADAAFVRVVNAIANQDSVSVSVGDREYTDIAFAEASAYYIIPQGTINTQLAETTQEMTIQAGKFYTVALTGADDGVDISLIEDGMNTNRAKALLSLYNLSSEPTVDLKTVDGAVDILLGVEPMQTTSVPVNAISVDLATFSDETIVTAFEGVMLERGAVYSAIVLDSEAGPAAIWVLTETVVD